MKYIDAEKLKAEIDGLESFSCIGEVQDGFYSAISRINDIIDSIQQEQPEVDLEKEIDKEWAKCEPIDEGMGLESANIVNEQFNSIALHFYELGLKARKEE